MKNSSIFTAITIAILFVSCGQDKASNDHQAPHDHSADNHNKEMTNHDEMGTMKSASQSSFSTKEIIANYLSLKNALTRDNDEEAAKAGKVLFETFNKINTSKVDENDKAECTDIINDAKEHAEHIGDNAGKIDHQREHFILLSEDLNDLIKMVGTSTQLYQDFCPMANEGKGAIWLSETKEIKNPYYGTKMSSCGSIKNTFN